MRRSATCGAGVVAAVLLLLSACTSQTAQDPTPTPPVTAEPPRTTAPTSSTPPVTSSPPSVSSPPASVPSPSVTPPSSVTSSTPSPSSSELGEDWIFDPSVSEGTFTITIADSIEEEHREGAQKAAEFVRDSIIFRNVMWHDLSDKSKDPQLEDFYVLQALDRIQYVQNGWRKNGWVYQGWLSGKIVVAASNQATSLVEVCHDFSNMTADDGTGRKLNLPPGQDGTYGVDLYPDGLRISTVTFDSETLRPC